MPSENFHRLTYNSSDEDVQAKDDPDVDWHHTVVAEEE